MEGRLVLKNGAVLRADGTVEAGMALVIERGKIVRMAEDREVPVLPGDWEVACRGRLVAPGLIDCHAHLTSGVLRPPSGWMGDTQERLERALDAADVEVLTRFALARAVLSGVTLVAEHLHAPGQVREALAAQAKAAQQVRVRLVHGHASSDRLGEREGLRQAEENAVYAEQASWPDHIRPALGLQASSMCGDGLLSYVGKAQEVTGAGVHLHLGEDADDLALTYARHGLRIVPRIEAFQLFSPVSVAAFARGIDRQEAMTLARHRVLVAWSPPLSVPGEEVGETPWDLLAAEHCLLDLGSGDSGSLAQVRSAWELFQGAKKGAHRLFRSSGASEWAAQVFQAKLGVLEEGALADLVVYDALPERGAETQPIPPRSSAWGGAAWVIVGGEVVVREGQLLAADVLELAREARRVQERLGSRS